MNDSVQHLAARCLPRYWSLRIDALLCALIIAVALAAYLRHASDYIDRARLAQVFTLAGQLRMHQVLEQAVHGRWPRTPPDDLAELGSGLTLARVMMEDGSFALIMRSGTGAAARRLDVAFRRAAAPGLGTLFWYCGRARVDQAAGVNMPDITTVPASHLPGQCRHDP